MLPADPPRVYLARVGLAIVGIYLLAQGLPGLVEWFFEGIFHSWSEVPVGLSLELIVGGFLVFPPRWLRGRLIGPETSVLAKPVEPVSADTEMPSIPVDAGHTGTDE